MLDAINEGKENNNGRIEDQYVLRFFRDKLLSMPCQNQGFIIDGFPKTMEQAKELFICKYYLKFQIFLLIILNITKANPYVKNVQHPNITKADPYI